jgi:hypothetical protein
LDVKTNDRDGKMKTLKVEEIGLVGGAMNWEGNRTSDNVIDLRGDTSNPMYTDASGMCWAPGTPSSSMYPNGADGVVDMSGMRFY